MHLFPTVDSVIEYNITKLHTINRQTATIKAIHSGHNASKGTSEHAGECGPVVHLQVHDSLKMSLRNLAACICQLYTQEAVAVELYIKRK